MMDQHLQNAFIMGYERMTAWADLLDKINVFPVADSDTGCNLRISLAPLLQLTGDRDVIIKKLLISATGNSGNIAACFFSGFLTVDSKKNLFQAAKTGRDYAWQAIADPKPGTMLTFFDEFIQILEGRIVNDKNESVQALIKRLEKTVLSTPDKLPVLKSAGVVDAGALGMFLYIEGFLKRLFNQADSFRPVTKIFPGKLKISSSFKPDATNKYCVDTVVLQNHPSGHQAAYSKNQLSKCGDNVVVFPDKSHLKIHLHTDNRDNVRKSLNAMGKIVQWSDEYIGDQVKTFSSQDVQQAIHIVTDAAGSVTRENACELGMTLLDSYINIGDRSLPETLLTPSELYAAMRKGVKVTTAQASIFQRHQCYQSILDQNKHVLYLCVGSVYTGNFSVVTEWKEENDPDNRLTIIDTGTASGRLGIIAIAVARYLKELEDVDKAVCFAREAVEKSGEYMFLDQLKYLVAGGRLSKTRGFFGDLLHMKPVISPLSDGAIKVGVMRSQDEQLVFALQKLNESLEKGSAPLIMLEYSDNQAWVDETVQAEVRNHYPLAEIMLQPLSLTSGVHMGPGTWAVAFLPEYI